jgi:hypothetical protein
MLYDEIEVPQLVAVGEAEADLVDAFDLMVGDYYVEI